MKFYLTKIRYISRPEINARRNTSLSPTWDFRCGAQWAGFTTWLIDRVITRVNSAKNNAWPVHLNIVSMFTYRLNAIHVCHFHPGQARGYLMVSIEYPLFFANQ